MIFDDGGDASSNGGGGFAVKGKDFVLVRCACHPIEQRKHDRTMKRTNRDLNVLDVAVGILVVGDLSRTLLLLLAKKPIMDVQSRLFLSCSCGDIQLIGWLEPLTSSSGSSHRRVGE